MSKKSPRAAGNPYAVLYWIGAGMVLLVSGVLALGLLRRQSAPDPERVLLWLYEAGDRSGPVAVAVIEESRSRHSLTVVPLPAPEQAGAVHHRLVLPYRVVARLVDAAGGISVAGKHLSGAGTLAYVREGREQGARRAVQVLLALAAAADAGGVHIGRQEAVSLARQLDTDMDYGAMYEMFRRWSRYSPHMAGGGLGEPILNNSAYRVGDSPDLVR